MDQLQPRFHCRAQYLGRKLCHAFETNLFGLLPVEIDILVHNLHRLDGSAVVRLTPGHILHVHAQEVPIDICYLCRDAQLGQVI